MSKKQNQKCDLIVETGNLLYRFEHSKRNLKPLGKPENKDDADIGRNITLYSIKPNCHCKYNKVKNFSKLNFDEAVKCFIESGGIFEDPCSWWKIMVLALFSKTADVMAKKYAVQQPCVLLKDIETVPEIMKVMLNIFGPENTYVKSEWTIKQNSVCTPDVCKGSGVISSSLSDYSKCTIYYKKSKLNVFVPYSCCTFIISKGVLVVVCRDLIEKSPLALPILIGNNANTKRELKIEISAENLMKLDFEMLRNLDGYSGKLNNLVGIFVSKLRDKKAFRKRIEDYKLKFIGIKQVGRITDTNADSETMLWGYALSVFECFLEFLTDEKLIKEETEKEYMEKIWRYVLPETVPKNGNSKLNMKIENPNLFMDYYLSYVELNCNRIQTECSVYNDNNIGTVKNLSGKDKEKYLIFDRDILFNNYKKYVDDNEGDSRFCENEGAAWQTKLQRILCHRFEFIKKSGRDCTWKYQMFGKNVPCIGIPVSNLPPKIREILRIDCDGKNEREVC